MLSMSYTPEVELVFVALGVLGSALRGSYRCCAIAASDQEAKSGVVTGSRFAQPRLGVTAFPINRVAAMAVTA